MQQKDWDELTATLGRKTVPAILMRTAGVSGPEQVVAETVRRHFSLMMRYTEDICKMLRKPELCLVIEACGPSIPSDAILDSLVEDVLFNALEEGRAEAWGVNPDEFCAKMVQLPAVAWFALADLASQVFTAGGDLDWVLEANGLQTLEEFETEWQH